MGINLAPVVLFVYNRPEHTYKTLKALSENFLAKKSKLIIYSDGPKVDASFEEKEKIRKVREVIRDEEWCSSNVIIESDRNRGLADSIVSGVSEVLNKYGKIIVLEDDIVTAQGFLNYMNEALDIYQDYENVMHIGSYLPYTNSITRLPETFFSRFMSCWGWGTWKSSWEKANWNTELLYKNISDTKVRYQFNLEGVLNFHEQLENNLSGAIKTWAIKWYASIFLNKGLCLYPNKSLSRNIGLDGSGENSESQEDIAHFHPNNTTEVLFSKPREDYLGKKYLKRFYTYGLDSSLERRLKHLYIKYRFKLIKMIKGI